MNILQFCQKQHSIAGECKLENVLTQALGDCMSLYVTEPPGGPRL